MVEFWLLYLLVESGVVARSLWHLVVVIGHQLVPWLSQVTLVLVVVEVGCLEYVIVSSSLVA